MKRRLLIIAAAVAVALAGIGVFVWLKDQMRSSSITEKKAPHFESSTPASTSTLPSPPPNVTIDFNFDLVSPSSLDILKDGKSYAENQATIDENKLAMRRAMIQNAPDGTYAVKYKACWPDNSCHDGQFSFSIDRAQQAGFMDLTNQSEVTVRLSQIKFAPMEVKVSKDTKVTWVNDDEVAHYVNTDAHPAHTHVPDLNSKALDKGDSYAYTFKKPGAYPYHCSAHASSMVGTVVVE